MLYYLIELLGHFLFPLDLLLVLVRVGRGNDDLPLLLGLVGPIEEVLVLALELLDPDLVGDVLLDEGRDGLVGLV